ncbi:MAG: hypothetical protein AABY22_09050, partial [Nanoarchaeota archaeon]
SLEDEDRLKISAVKNLEEELDKLRKQKSISPIYVGGGSASGGHIVKAHDLSASLNGSLKTFSLPAFWRVISVSLSSLTPLRENVDFTVNGSNFTLTFTSEVDESTLLAVGQSCLVIYSE